MDRQKLFGSLIAPMVMAAFGVSSAAGSVYTNDSGITAQAFRIEFSEPVTITNFGGTFAVQEPEGEGSEFVFSGGKAKEWDSIGSLGSQPR
ncbi:MAG TPA: hypothetical protein ENH11_08640 [Candidatus Acetothermia bacterium]|nr:hypothetical protein [Candidatus Acetothermia bacterium]